MVCISENLWSFCLDVLTLSEDKHETTYFFHIAFWLQFMWGHAESCSCVTCKTFHRIFHLIELHNWSEEFKVFVETKLRLLEADLRDELTRLKELQGKEREDKKEKKEKKARKTEGSQKAARENSQNRAKTGPPGATAKKLPSPPAEHPEPGPVKEEGENQDREPVAEVEGNLERSNPASSHKERPRDKEDRDLSPAPRKDAKERRKRSRSRRRRRALDTSSEGRPVSPRSSGGRKEKKSRALEVPLPPSPPRRHEEDEKELRPRAPSYSPPERLRGKGEGGKKGKGKGWKGHLPVSSHPRWKDSKNKGQVKRAKQEYYARRNR